MENKNSEDDASPEVSASESSKNLMSDEVQSNGSTNKLVEKPVFKIPTFVKKTVNKFEKSLQNEKLVNPDKLIVQSSNTNIDDAPADTKNPVISRERRIFFQPKSLTLPSRVYKPHRPSATEYIKHFHKKEKEKLAAENSAPTLSDRENATLITNTTSKQDSSADKPKATKLNYNKPEWSCTCEENPDHAYSLEVLKTGSIIDKINLANKEYFIFGRASDCDVVLEHPSISRLVPTRA